MRKISRFSTLFVLLGFAAVLPLHSAESIIGYGEPAEPRPAEAVVRIDPLLQEMINHGSTAAGPPGGVVLDGMIQQGSGLASGVEPGMVDVNIFLAVQGGDAIGEEVRAAHSVRVNELSEEILAIRRAAFPKDKSLGPAEEQLFARQWVNYVSPDDQDRLRSLKEDLDAELFGIDQEITSRLTQRFEPSQGELSSYIESIGGTVKSRLKAMNIITARVPLGQVTKLAEHPALLSISANRPGEPELNNQLSSLGVSTGFHSDSPAIDGYPWDVGSVDDGVDETHTDLSSHTFYENYSTNGYHATGTIGMYASTNSTYKGLAFGLDAIIVENAGSEATSMDGFDWVLTTAADSPEVTNYSWGNGTANDSDYNDFDRFFDGLVTTYDTLISKSCGNGGFGTTTITHPAPAYNILTSANMYDVDTTSRTDDYIWSTSSTGPTLNGRKKPDITAPGNNTYTMNVGGGYQNLGGTSSAAPKTGAGALLLQDFGISDSKRVRATLINTADAYDSNGTSTTSDDVTVAGDFWDPRFGWGYLDLWEAWFNAADSFSDSVAPRLTTGEYDLFAGYMVQNEKATLVWNRRVSANGDTYPVTWYNLTDVNLRMYDEVGGASTYEDWDFDTDDNVHQVSAQSNGDKVVKVYAWSTSIDGSSVEPYALAVEENWVKVTGPNFSSIGYSFPGTLACGEQFNITYTVPNTGDITGHNLSVTLNLPTGFTIVAGSNPMPVGSVAAGATGTAAWTLKAPTGSSGWFGFSASYTSDSYGGIVQSGTSATASTYVNPAPANSLCSGSVIVPSTYGTYSYSGDTTYACEDYDGGGACTGWDSAGRDLVYAVYLTADTQICATMTPTGFDASLYLATDCGNVGGSCLAGSDVVGVAVENFCVDVSPGGGDWYYIFADAYAAGVGGAFDLEITIAAPAPSNTLSTTLDALPSSGQVPFTTQFTARLINLTTQNRRAAARINVMLANGTPFSNWKSGWTNLSDSETFTSFWNQSIPALGSVIGTNTFTMVGEDVTPAPFNQPPYSPSGDTDTDVATVVATN